ncbi:hypothetical protein Hanom_Chr17g01580981 [Helianthus anomalus]
MMASPSSAAEPQHGTSSIHQHRSATHQRSSKHRGILFSEMAKDEKVEFLFLQLQAAAGQMIGIHNLCLQIEILCSRNRWKLIS